MKIKIDNQKDIEHYYNNMFMHILDHLDKSIIVGNKEDTQFWFIQHANFLNHFDVFNRIILGNGVKNESS